MKLKFTRLQFKYIYDNDKWRIWMNIEEYINNAEAHPTSHHHLVLTLCYKGKKIYMYVYTNMYRVSAYTYFRAVALHTYWIRYQSRGLWLYACAWDHVCIQLYCIVHLCAKFKDMKNVTAICPRISMWIKNKKIIETSE